MNDRPPGKWGEVLVGAWWPGSPVEPEAGIQHWSTQQRLKVNEAATLDRFLRLVGSDNKGRTAEDLILRLRTGRNAMTGIASRCAAKSLASRLVTDAVNRLRQTLAGIAERDNRRIEDIVQGSLPAPAKLAAVNAVVVEANTAAAAAELDATSAIVDATQQMFTGLTSGDDARQWLAAHGAKFDSPAPKPLSTEEFTRTAGASNGSAPGKDPANSTATSPTQELETHTGAAGASSTTDAPGGGLSSGGTDDAKAGDHAVSSNGLGNTGQAIGGANANAKPSEGETANTTGSDSIHVGERTPTPSPTPPSTPTDHPLPTAPPVTSSGPAPTTAPGPTTPAALAAPATGGVPAPPITAPTVQPALADLAQPHSTAPPPFTANPTDTGALSAHAPAAPVAAPLTPLSPATASTADPWAGAPPPTAPQAVTAPPIAPLPGAVGLAASGPAAPFAATPTPPPAPPIAPAAVGGSLPAYGADLRPPAATPVAPAGGSPVATPPASATAPGSPDRPAHPTAAASPAATAGRAAPAPAGTAVASATAGTAGAAVGHAGKRLADQADLHRKLAAVARQAPMLTWAAGLRADETTTVLVTDLAGGWIPPTVALPAGVSVLPPARRRAGAGAADLLGPVVAAATHAPHAALPAPDSGGPTGSGERARHVDPVPELGPALLDAVRRCPGLPRIAQTLAAALARRTGVDDNEVGLFRQVCAGAATAVLSTYPEHTGAAVAEWMLLAAVDALLDGRRHAAHYHLAWHRAVTAVDEGAPR